MDKQLNTSLTRRLLFLFVVMIFFVIPFGGGAYLSGSIAYAVYLYEDSFSSSKNTIQAEILGFDYKEKCYSAYRTRASSNLSKHNECTSFHIVNFQYVDPQKGIIQDKRTVRRSLWNALKKNHSDVLIEYNHKITYPHYLLPAADILDIEVEQPTLRIVGEDEMLVVYAASIFSLPLFFIALLSLIHALRGVLSENYYKRKMGEQKQAGH